MSNFLSLRTNTSAQWRAAIVMMAISATFSFGQQPNTVNAALSINGTGRIDPLTATVVSTNSQVVPPPTGAAPTLYHTASPRSALRFAIQGPIGRAIILALGTINPSPIAVGTDLFHLVPSTAEVLVDGTNPSNLLNFSAAIGAGGEWALELPTGLPAPFPILNFQGIVVDPTAPPFGLRFTAAESLEIKNDLSTLAKNVVDAFTMAPRDPLYLLSLFSATGFTLDGVDATGALIEALQSNSTNGGEEIPKARRLIGIGPNTTAAPALPAGGPSPGQSIPIYLDIQNEYAPAFGAPVRAERERNYDFTMIEELGTWRFRGNQRDAYVAATLRFEPGVSTPQGLDVTLEFVVESSSALHGGLASVAVTGPQLNSVNFNGQATSAAVGTYVMSPGPFDDPGEAFAAVVLGAAGTSRMPLVENLLGPRDSYSFLINWQDGTTSGPYIVYLRAAVDVDAAPASALAAIPGTPTGSLIAGGTAGAVLNVAFSVGSLAGLPTFGATDITIAQGPLLFEFDKLFPATAAPIPLQLALPGLFGATTTVVVLETSDVFGADYRRFLTQTF